MNFINFRVFNRRDDDLLNDCFLCFRILCSIDLDLAEDAAIVSKAATEFASLPVATSTDVQCSLYFERIVSFADDAGVAAFCSTFIA